VTALVTAVLTALCAVGALELLLVGAALRSLLRGGGESS
jgi:hypothetical protein